MVNVINDVFKSVVVEGAEGQLRVDEGDKIKFVVETTGVIKEGVLLKISGKGEKTKLQIMPKDNECEEVWSIVSMREKSLEVVK